MHMTYEEWVDAGHSPFDWRNEEGLSLADLIAAGRDPSAETEAEPDQAPGVEAKLCEAVDPA